MSKSSERRRRRHKNKHKTQQQQQNGAPLPISDGASVDTEEDSEQPRHKLSRRQKLFQHWGWTQTLEFCGVVLLGVYTYLTYGLWIATNDAVNLTREQVHTGQRAWLIIEKIRLIDPPEVGKGIRATLNIKNVGQTPALKVRVEPVLDFFTDTPPAATSDASQASDIGPGQTIPIFDNRVNPLTADELAAMNKPLYALNGTNFTLAVRDSRLFFAGVIKYADVFGGTGETEFCVVYAPESMHTIDLTGEKKTFLQCTAASRNHMK